MIFETQRQLVFFVLKKQIRVNETAVFGIGRKAGKKIKVAIETVCHSIKRNKIVVFAAG